MKPAANRIPRTFATAHAAGTDAGNAAMRKAGRRRWTRADYNAAVRAFNVVLPGPTK